MKTLVKFLIETDRFNPGLENERRVFAFFPYESDFDNKGNKMSYSHIGQHSACAKQYANECPIATKEEYQILFDELESIGYDLQVLKEEKFMLFSQAQQFARQKRKEGFFARVKSHLGIAQPYRIVEYSI